MRWPDHMVLLKLCHTFLSCKALPSDGSTQQFVVGSGCQKISTQFLNYQLAVLLEMIVFIYILLQMEFFSGKKSFLFVCLFLFCLLLGN